MQLRNKTKELYVRTSSPFFRDRTMVYLNSMGLERTM